MLSNLNSTNGKQLSSLQSEIKKLKEQISDIEAALDGLAESISTEDITSENITTDTLETRDAEVTNNLDVYNINADNITVDNLSATNSQLQNITGDVDIDGDITADSITVSTVNASNLNLANKVLDNLTLGNLTVTGDATIDDLAVNDLSVSHIDTVDVDTLTADDITSTNMSGEDLTLSGDLSVAGDATVDSLTSTNNISTSENIIGKAAQITETVNANKLIANETETSWLNTSYILAKNNSSYVQTTFPSMTNDDIITIHIPFFTGLLNMKLQDSGQTETYAVLQILATNAEENTVYDSDIIQYSEKALTYINYITQNEDGSWDIGFNGATSNDILNYMYWVNQVDESDSPSYEVNKSIDYTSQVFYFPEYLSRTIVWGDDTVNAGLDILGQLRATITPTFDNYDFSSITVENSINLKDTYDSETQSWSYTNGEGDELDYITTATDENNNEYPVWKRALHQQSGTITNPAKKLITETTLAFFNGTTYDSDTSTSSYNITELGDGTTVHGDLTVEDVTTLNDTTVNASKTLTVRGNTKVANLSSLVADTPIDIEEDLDATGFEITADKFIGNLEGVADKAIADQNGDDIDSTYQKISEKGVANGYASLDENGRIPVNQLSLETIVFRGGWDASTGVYPSNAITGDQYIIETAGTIDGEYFYVGDFILYNGTTWAHISSRSIVLGTTDPGIPGGLWYS